MKKYNSDCIKCAIESWYFANNCYICGLYTISIVYNISKMEDIRKIIEK